MRAMIAGSASHWIGRAASHWFSRGISRAALEWCYRLLGAAAVAMAIQEAASGQAVRELESSWAAGELPAGAGTAVELPCAAACFRFGARRAPDPPLA